MKNHLYTEIVKAVNNKILHEPFNSADLRKALPHFNSNTINGYLSKYRNGNPGHYMEYFELVKYGKYKLIRPFKHGL